MDPRPSKRRKIEQEQQTQGTLIQLNYDCLRYVFSYLTVRDLLQMEGIHKRFKDLAQDLYKTHRELDVSKLIQPRNKSISTAEAEKIFRRVGPYVETLKLSRNEIHGIKPLRFIWKYCKNLKAVYFNKIKFHYDEFAIKLAPVFKDVTIAHMIDCNDLTDYRLRTMFQLQKLKVLMVPIDNQYRNGPNGSSLQNLRDIEELSLKDNKKLHPHQVLEFFKKDLSNLRVLNILNCGAIHGDTLRAIATKHQNLECLKFNIQLGVSKTYYLALMDLPKLKEVQICHHNECAECDMGVLICKLATHNRLESLNVNFRGKPTKPETWDAIRSFTNLKTFKISELTFCPHIELLGMSSADTLEELGVNHTEISDLGIEKLVENFKNIRSIDILQCWKLTHEFFPKIMNHLTGRRHKLQIKECRFDIASKYEEMYKSDVLQVVTEKWNRNSWMQYMRFPRAP